MPSIRCLLHLCGADFFSIPASFYFGIVTRESPQHLYMRTFQIYFSARAMNTAAYWPSSDNFTSRAYLAGSIEYREKPLADTRKRRNGRQERNARRYLKIRRQCAFSLLLPTRCRGHATIDRASIDNICSRTPRAQPRSSAYHFLHFRLASQQATPIWCRTA